MDDYISRQAAIDAAALSAAEWDGMYVQDINGRIREALEKLPSVQPEPKWIPVSERLPEEGVSVLLCIKDWESQKTKMVVSLRRDYNYWDGLGRDIRGDIAWMPLPEPYKTESEDKE